MKGPKRPPSPEAGFRRDPRVTEVAVDSRRLFVVEMQTDEQNPDLNESIVWVRPHPEATPGDVAAYLKSARDAGAVRVELLPREASDAAVPASVHEQEVEATGTAKARIRAVVAELLDEVSEMREEVSAIVERALADAGG